MFMLRSLAKLFVSRVWVCVITPPTVKSSTIVTSSGKSTVILPLLPTVSVIAILPVVPKKVTEDFTPDPVPPAVKFIIAELEAPAATGNVYVSFVLAGNVTVLVFTAVT